MAVQYTSLWIIRFLYTYVKQNLFIFHCQLYVELAGTQDQPANVPPTVHLRIRHLSGSRFRAGDDSVKEYRQPLGSFRKIKFRRTAISDETRCGEEERNGNSKLKDV